MERALVLLITWFVLVAAQNTKQPVREGNDLFVFCDGERSPQTSVYWESSNLQYHQDGPSLTINHITRNSADDYECFEIDHSTNATKKIFEASVDVTYPANILENKLVKDTLVENETFSTEIIVEGNPFPDVKLVQMSNSALAYQSVNNQGKLSISFVVHCNNMDRYLLTCSNELNYDHLYFNITVLCVPRPDPKKAISYIQKPRVGQYVKLEMFATGYPPPNYTWYHNDTVIEHVDSGYTSFVNLQSMKVDDFGNYTVTMSNSVGENIYQYWIEADGPPDSATDLQAGTITTTSAILSWLPGFDYGNKQTFTIIMTQNGEKQELDTVTLEDHSLDRVTHTISNLNPATTYDMEIKSSNRKGEASNLSNKVQFNTPAVPPPEPPSPSEASMPYPLSLRNLLLPVLIALLEI
ncbi:myosin-binding protein C, fast-type-like [Mercenaria mercenaria]|uniref:myosin-binding protein C, fast-type-like n=1 Tax=Mercenaria mercenaria TaxID=6596 RepID=UPI00234E4CD8|nr:myosin-binding protein C, fast-type-like [Mercenaria mercenaria]